MPRTPTYPDKGSKNPWKMKRFGVYFFLETGISSGSGVCGEIDSGLPGHRFPEEERGKLCDICKICLLL